MKRSSESHSTFKNNKRRKLNEIEAQKINNEKKIKSYMKLPIYKDKATILNDINNFDVYILSSTTGSGKTTQIPKFLYESGYGNNRKQIGITQPRQLAAKSTAARVAYEMSTNLGEEVGYVVRFDHKASSKTRIKFMTDGILLQESKHDKFLQNYSVIILDEVHERSLNTEILIGILKNAQKIRSTSKNKLKIVIMSATMNISLFKNYFIGESSVTSLCIYDELHPLEIVNTKLTYDDYVRQAVMVCLSLHVGKVKSPTNVPDFVTNVSHSVLIFLTGEEEIKRCCSMLKQASVDLIEKKFKGINAMPLYAALTDEDKDKAISNNKCEERNVIVATNIAETSLTIPGVRIVIDSGKCKRKVVKNGSIMESLEVQWISKGQAHQRAGRCSRLGPGTGYRLYSEKDYIEKMPDETPSELTCQTNLVTAVLQIISFGFSKSIEFPWLEHPDNEKLKLSEFILHDIKAIKLYGESNGYKVTKLGHILLKFPLDPRLGLVLLESSKKENSCLSEAITVVSMLNVVEDLWIQKDYDKNEDKIKYPNTFDSYLGDLVSLLLIFKEFKKKMNVKGDVAWNWCKQNSLKFVELRRAQDIRDQLRKICNEINLGNSRTENYSLINKCFVKAFPHQIAQLTQTNEKKKKSIMNQNPRTALYQIMNPIKKMDGKTIGGCDDDDLFRLHPTSILCDRDYSPHQVLYLTCIKSTKPYLRYLAALTPEMIARNE